MIRLLESATGRKEAEGACLYASILLSQTLNRFTPHRAQVRGGGPPLAGGFLDRTGQLRGHYWVEVATSTEAGAGPASFIVDITADQFGEEPVLILPVDIAREHYIAGDQSRIDMHVAEEMAEIRSRTHQASGPYL